MNKLSKNESGLEEKNQNKVLIGCLNGSGVEWEEIDEKTAMELFEKTSKGSVIDIFMPH